MHPDPHLSKSRYVAGLQCPKMLWWRVHEPDAPETVAEADVQTLLDRGQAVGVAARAHVPGGVLIDFPPYRVRERVAATAEAMASRAPVLYEASFVADGVFVSVDILERRRHGFVLTEVKSSLDVKDEYIPDIAIQLHVLRRAGVPVRRAEVMHLNRDCRHPDLSNLFVRRNVTRLAEAEGRSVPRKVRSLLEVLRGPRPEVATGPHCKEPYECPFIDRCWPALPKHHVSTLYRISTTKLDELLKAGHETLLDLPPDYPTTDVMRRQIASVRRQRVVVEPELAEALAEIEPPIAFLDFETVSPAIPVWPGCRPYDQIPVQLSCHRIDPRGPVHHDWLADGPDDPRELFARALLGACQGAGTVLAYHAPFERRCIASLGEAVPRLAGPLSRLHDRVKDLLSIVRDHVYHPRFLGSFSIKDVLPALVPDMGYDDLEIQDGGTASAALEAMLLSGDRMQPSEKRLLRRNLLKYCERDTLAMVRVYQRLCALAGRSR